MIGGGAILRNKNIFCFLSVFILCVNMFFKLQAVFTRLFKNVFFFSYLLSESTNVLNDKLYKRQIVPFIKLYT